MQLLQDVTNICRGRFELAAVCDGDARMPRHQVADPMCSATVEEPEEAEDARMRGHGKTVAVRRGNHLMIAAGRPKNGGGPIRRHTLAIR